MSIPLIFAFENNQNSKLTVIQSLLLFVILTKDKIIVFITNLYEKTITKK